MRICIHRGACEIGGNCVEFEAGGKRLVVDIGRSLDGSIGGDVAPPYVKRLAREGSLTGVVLSHPHQDHYGFVEYLDPAAPVYIGESAAAILGAAVFFSHSGVRLGPVAFLEDRQPLEVGPFSITPYLVDHSAFDSYALMIEGGGRRVFYSGDFRAHGRKASLVDRLRSNAPKDVDVLLLEGTHIRPRGEAFKGPDESELELAMAETFRSTQGLVTVFSSAQNIDRLVTIYRACKRARRTLVIDLYTATVARATGRATIPQPGFSRLRVYVPNRQRILVKRCAEFERVEAIRQYRVFLEEIRANAGQFVMVVQGSTLQELGSADCLEGASAIWSLWPGYLERPSGERATRLLQEHAVPLLHLHASGHARVKDLRALAAALAPARLVPIHSIAPERFAELFEKVERHDDGEWWAA